MTIFVTLVGVPIGFFWVKDKWHEISSTPQQLYEDEYFIKGILIPDELLSTNDYIGIIYGQLSMEYPVGYFKQGFSFTPNMFICNDSAYPISIGLRIINNRLYVSTSFKDFQKEEIVGIMNYNHWSLFKPNLLNYKDDNQRLEVYDRGGNIIFSIKFQYPNIISLKGYFINARKYALITDNGYIPCMPKTGTEWKNGLSESVKNITSIFP